MTAEDPREGPRRVDVTLCLHLDSGDTKSSSEAVVAALLDHLPGESFRVTAGDDRTTFVIDHVDAPIHVHSVIG